MIPLLFHGFAFAEEPNGDWLYNKNLTYLNELTLRSSFLESHKVTYTRKTYLGFSSEEKSFNLANFRNYSDPAIAIVRFPESKWEPSLLERAQEESKESEKDPWESEEPDWGEIDPEVDTAVEEIEVLSLIPQGVECIFNSFLQFDIYPHFVSNFITSFFIYSYALNETEIELLSLPKLPEGDLYHYNVFHAPFLGDFQMVIRYVPETIEQVIKQSDKLIKYNEKRVSWELIPLEDFEPLPGRGSEAEKSEERETRGAITDEMYVNNGYMIISPLILDEVPQGKHEVCNLDGKNCVATTPENEETVANGIFYLRPEDDYGTSMIWERQVMMETVIEAIVNGLSGAITASVDDGFYFDDYGTKKEINIKGCQ